MGVIYDGDISRIIQDESDNTAVFKVSQQGGEGYLRNEQAALRILRDRGITEGIIHVHEISTKTPTGEEAIRLEKFTPTALRFDDYVAAQEGLERRKESELTSKFQKRVGKVLSNRVSKMDLDKIMSRISVFLNVAKTSQQYIGLISHNDISPQNIAVYEGREEERGVVKEIKLFDWNNAISVQEGEEERISYLVRIEKRTRDGYIQTSKVDTNPWTHPEISKENGIEEALAGAVEAPKLLEHNELYQALNVLYWSITGECIPESQEDYKPIENQVPKKVKKVASPIDKLIGCVNTKKLEEYDATGIEPELIILNAIVKEYQEEKISRAREDSEESIESPSGLTDSVDRAAERLARIPRDSGSMLDTDGRSDDYAGKIQREAASLFSRIENRYRSMIKGLTEKLSEAGLRITAKDAAKAELDEELKELKEELESAYNKAKRNSRTGIYACIIGIPLAFIVGVTSTCLASYYLGERQQSQYEEILKEICPDANTLNDYRECREGLEWKVFLPPKKREESTDEPGETTLPEKISIPNSNYEAVEEEEEEITEEEPKPKQRIQKIPESEIQERYTQHVQEGNVGEILRLHEATNVQPVFSEKDAQKGYAMCVRMGEIDHVTSLHELTEIAPDFSEEDVQTGYIACIRNGKFDRIRKIQELTGIRPVYSNSDIQEEYSAHIRMGNVDAIKRIQELTGIQPRFEEEDVQAGLRNCIRKGWIEDIEQIQEMNPEVVPTYTEKDVREGYAFCARTANIECITNLNRQNLSVRPEFEEEDVQQGYGVCNRRKDAQCSRELRAATGIRDSTQL